MLNFKDVYYGYNQIKIDRVDAPKTSFISNHGNYYYNIIPFGINKACATLYTRAYGVLEIDREYAGGVYL